TLFPYTTLFRSLHQSSLHSPWRSPDMSGRVGDGPIASDFEMVPFQCAFGIRAQMAKLKERTDNVGKAIVIGPKTGRGWLSEGVIFRQPAAAKFDKDTRRRDFCLRRGWMEINNGRFETHGDIRVAGGSSLAKGVGHLGRLQQKEIRQLMNKSRHRFVVGVDAADGIAGFVLERRKGAPLMNGPLVVRRRGSDSEKQERNSKATKRFHGISISHGKDKLSKKLPQAPGANGANPRLEIRIPKEIRNSNEIRKRSSDFRISRIRISFGFRISAIGFYSLGFFRHSFVDTYRPFVIVPAAFCGILLIENPTVNHF